MVLLIGVGKAGGCLRKTLDESTSGSKGKQETESEDFLYTLFLPPSSLGSLEPHCR